MDNIICGICKGEKVLRDKVTQQLDICPKCKGLGKLPSYDSNVNEVGSKKKIQNILLG